MLLIIFRTYARGLPLDRVSRASTTPQAILYFEPEGPTAQSSSLIEYLDYHAGYRPDFSYIIRYRPSPGQNKRSKSKMAGYGVELALKRTDYLVVDDRNSGSAVPGSQDQSSNASLSSGSFEEILGSDPWADLAVPLTKSEVMGKSRCGNQS
jgi:UDP-glucose:glycoprotein glucosyltransferase